MPDTTSPKVTMALENSLPGRFEGKQQLPRRSWRCPSDEDIARYVDGTLAAGQQPGLETHLTRCERCRFVVADTIKSQRENELPTPPSALLYKTMQVASVKRAGKYWLWIPAGALAALLVSLLTVPTLLRHQTQVSIPPPKQALAPLVAKSAPVAVPQKPILDIVREQPSTAAVPSVILPKAGSVVARKELKFSWKEIPGARSYEVRVVTSEGDLVWEGQSDQPAVALPADATLKDGSYFVWITSYFANGRTIKSSPVLFVVKG